MSAQARVSDGTTRSAQGGDGEAESQGAKRAPLACFPDLAASSEERLLTPAAPGMSCRFLCDQDRLEGDSAGTVCWAAADEGESRGLAGDARLPAGLCSLAAPPPPPPPRCLRACCSIVAQQLHSLLRLAAITAAASAGNIGAQSDAAKALRIASCTAPCMVASPHTMPTKSCAETTYCALVKSNTMGPRQQACMQEGRQAKLETGGCP